MKNNNNLNYCKSLLVHNFVLGLPAPSELAPHTIYFVKTATGLEMYVTDANAIAYEIGGSGGGSITLTSPQGTISIIENSKIDISPTILESIKEFHNDFPDLQGGQDGEYYHLTLSQLNSLVAIIANGNPDLQTVLQEGSTAFGITTPVYITTNQVISLGALDNTGATQVGLSPLLFQTLVSSAPENTSEINLTDTTSQIKLTTPNGDTELSMNINENYPEVLLTSSSARFIMSSDPTIGNTIVDNNFNKGFTYNEDYTENQLVDDRAITDVGGVKQLIEQVSITEWVAGTYDENNFVYTNINNQQYIFRSNSSNNTTQPLLNSNKAAWVLPPYGGTFAGVWSPGTYTADQIVVRSNYVYYCLSTNSEDPILLNPPNWIKLGFFRGGYDSSEIYSNGNIVIDGSNQVYISNYNQNTYPLNYGVVSNWTVVNGQFLNVVAWGDSLTFGSGSTGTGDYPTQLSINTNINIDSQGVPGETSTQIKTRFLAAPEKWKYPTIIWAGRNNYPSTTVVKADIAEMISKLPHTNYLVLGIIKATSDANEPIDTLNADLKAIYGDRFIDIQPYLLSIYDSSIPQDVTDHANGVNAWSMRSDWLHLSNKGYYYVAKKISASLNYLMGIEDFKTSLLDASSAQITGNTIPEYNAGIEMYYIGDTGYIDAFDRNTQIPKNLSISYPQNSKLTLLQQGGELFFGPIDGYSTGNIKNIARLSTGRVVELPSISTNRIPVQNANGTYRDGKLADTGNEVTVNTTVVDAGWDFQVNGLAAIGTTGQTKVRMGTLSPTLAFLQFSDNTINQKAAIFASKFMFGTSVDSGNGELAQFNGEISVATATHPSSAVRLDQIGIKTTASTTPNTVVDPAVATSYRLNTGVTSVTLPPLTGNAGKILFFINNTVADIPLNSNSGGNDIWSGGADVNIENIPAGSPIRLIHDGTQWALL